MKILQFERIRHQVRDNFPEMFRRLSVPQMSFLCGITNTHEILSAIGLIYRKDLTALSEAMRSMGSGDFDSALFKDPVFQDLAELWLHKKGTPIEYSPEYDREYMEDVPTELSVRISNAGANELKKLYEEYWMRYPCRKRILLHAISLFMVNRVGGPS